MAVELNRDNYEDEVLKAEEPVIVDFWGPLCGPCLALMPAVDKLEEEFKGKIKVGKVNASENRMLCVKVRVIGLPTFLVYKDGEEINRLTGNDITEKDLYESINQVVG
jgi:thioredoxin 1